jgi:hypothetical protein
MEKKVGDEKTIEILTEEMRADLEPEIQALESAAFDAGVEEGLKLAKNPGYKPQIKNATKARPDANANRPAAPSPTEIAKRAHALQAEASLRGEKLTNEQACRLAYEEAGIAV